MSLQSFPAALRILQSVATVEGAQDSLESINTTLVSDRALVAVAENNAVYMLRKDSVAAPSIPDIVAPAAGPGRWFLYPTASGDSAFDPIQQQRFYDTTSAVTPRNGSIRAPYNTFAAFWTEIGAAATGAWELTLPGTAVTIDGTIPAFSGTPVIGLKGLGQTKTVLNSFAPQPQPGDPSFYFRDMTVTSFVPTSGSGISIYGENVTFGLSESSGTFTGTARFRNCTFSTDFGLNGMVMTLDECNITGSFVCQVGSIFRDCIFNDGFTLSFDGDGFITLEDCDIGTGSIVALGDGTIHVDGYTWQTLIDSVIVRSCQMVIKPIPHVFDQMAGTTENVSGVAVFNYDLGEPTPRAEPSSFAQVTWPTGHPSDVNISIVSASVDASGHILVQVYNPTVDTITLTSPQFLVNYMPRLASGT